MDALHPAAYATIVALQVLILLAALQDAVQLKISNLLSLAIVGCFGVWLIVVGPDWSLWQNGVGFTLVFTLGLLLFSRGLLGGGDVKLLGALALWFDLQGTLTMVMVTAIAGGALALLLMTIRRLLPVGITAAGRWVLLRRGGPIPYALVVAMGALAAIHLHGVNPLPLTALQRINGLVSMPG